MASIYAKLAPKDILALLEARDKQLLEQENQIADLKAMVACLEGKNEDLLDSIAAAFPKRSGKGGIALTAPVEVSCGGAMKTSLWCSPVGHTTVWPSPVGHATVWPSPVGQGEYDAAAAEARRIGDEEDKKDLEAVFKKAVQVVEKADSDAAVRKHFDQVKKYLAKTYRCLPTTQKEWVEVCNELVALNIDALMMVRPNDYTNIQGLAASALTLLSMGNSQGFKDNINDLRRLLSP